MWFAIFNPDGWEAALGLITFALLLAVVFVIAGFRFLPSWKIFKILKLENNIEAQVSVDEVHGIKKGMQGTCVTDLRPVGKAEIEGKIVEVLTRGEFLAASNLIEVDHLSGNQIFVKQRKQQT